ncbi:MAG: hypothetical protein VXZ83_04330 [Verrucomicrobiota bacterium]|nr:hypothetical protein [Verrucomicrobiota bacterium]
MREIVLNKIEDSKAGFALVISLSMMAFVLLLVLSVNTLVVVEQRSADTAKQQLTAKQNALIGLQIAIGELQQHLGPDQRATASADILDSSNNPYTLVWHSDPTKGWDSTTNEWSDSGTIQDFALPLLSVDPSKLTTLISSGGEFNESALDNPIELMAITKPNNGTLTSLKAERRPLIDAQGATTGKYAWVAQDESLKANLKTEYGDYQNTDSDLALVETSRRLSLLPYANAAGITYSSVSDNNEVEISNKGPFRNILPVVNGELNPDYFEKIERAEDLSDLITSGLLIPANKSGSSAEQIAPYRNHFTLNSKGVLADTKNGGLRRDLSRGLDDQYYEKLHGVPVFGVDRNGNVIADGISEPVGDQWKFFRDFYHFYRPIDDGLVSDLSSKNIFYGLSDVTATNPSVRMRITNEDVAQWGTNDIFQRYGKIPTYAGALTPTTIGRNKFYLTDNDWYVFTPQLRPVVLRNICNIGIKSREITDPTDINVGKYVLEFQVYPSFTIWNPFNVAIEFNPSSNSQNPLANGEELYIFQNGNVDLIFEDQDGNTFKFDLQSICPNVTVLSDQSLSNAGLPTSLPPGAVWVCGLSQSYYAELDGYNPRYYNDPGLTDRTNDPTLLPAAVGSTVSELNNITYTNAAEVTQVNWSNVWQTVYFDGTDVLTLKSSGYGSFRWDGRIKSRNPVNPNNSTTYSCFSLGENSDVTGINTNIVIGEVQRLATGNAFPFNAIDFRANTTGNQGNKNPAFPTFSQVNFLGSYPQVVAPDDGRGDVKALYIRERSEANSASLTDPLPPHDSSGNGYYGKGFDTGSSGSNNIVLYDLPRHPIVSINDFRHLMLGWNEDAQARPIGASWPVATLNNLSDPYIRTAYPNGHNTGTSNSQYVKGAGCDTSYYYNNTLFDSYFFSGIPSEKRDENSELIKQTFPYKIRFTQDYIDDGKPLANTRLVYYKESSLEDLRGYTDNDLADDGYEKAGAHLLIDAPFNINSTSSLAWQAILSGFRNQNITGVNSTYSSIKNYSGNGTPFVDHFIPADDDSNIYRGHRRLSDNDIKKLTQALTSEIRSRGVANTLGNFVNRSLNSSSEIIDQQMSRMDEAIQNAGLNNKQVHGTTPDGDRYSRPDIADSARMFDKSMVKETSAGLPGYLKQQDILRALAPIMTSRGDTFTIRAYGEAVDPITGNPAGKAWCEALVQRIPEYTEDTISPWDIPPNNSNNYRFGRRIKIVQFRWLSSKDV